MMFQKLTSDEFEMIKKIEKLTFTDYELLGDFIPCDSLMCIIEDLMVELEHKNEEIEDLEEYRKQYCDLYDKYCL